jgi:putative ABC transport system ATP-binding protein
MQRRADRVLATVDLAGKERRKVRTLSGGEQQRAAIARALVNDPEVVVADEPTAHLDRTLARELMRTLEGLSRDGRTLIIATHDPLVVEHPLVTRVVSVRDGRLDGEERR